MNNISQKKNYIPVFIHIFFCVFILSIPLLSHFNSSNAYDLQFYPAYLVRTMMMIIMFYVNYFILIDRFLFRKQILYYILLNIGLVVLLLLIQTVTLDFILPHPRPKRMVEMINEMQGNQGMQFQKGNRQGPPDNFDMRRWTDLMFSFLVIGLSVALKVTSRWYRDSINLETMKSTKLEADLRNLRNQLNPHFLFNTLNNIYSLIGINKEKAQDAVLRLSNLLRYVLYEENEKFVPIDKELDFTRNYIDLMKLRLTSRVKLTVDIKNDGSNDRIASLLFMTLIENAFKHGINSNNDSFIDINILAEKEKGVICTVENSLSETDRLESKNSGIGLSNMSQRLNLLYPDAHEFHTERRINSFYAMLRIDFSKPVITE